MLNILWASKTGDANAWYHINPFRQCDMVGEIHVVRFKKPNRPIENVKYYTFSAINKPIEILNFILSSIKVLLTNKIDLVVSFNPYPWGIISFLFAKISRKPILLGLIGGELEPKRTGALKRRFLLKILKHVDIITVTGEDTKTQLAELGLNKEKLYIFPHLVDIEYLKKAESKMAKSDFITISSFLPVKRTEDAIRAISMLVSSGFDHKLVILGDGPSIKACKDLVNELKMEKNVFFTGFVEDIRPYINNSEYYLQTSSSEGLSISLIESMSVGLIPIATNVGDEKWVIKDGKTGFFVPVGEPNTIAEKIKYIEKNHLKKKLKENISLQTEHYTSQKSNYYITEILTGINK